MNNKAVLTTPFQSKIYRIALLIFSIAILWQPTNAQVKNDEAPFIGAEIFIEPGQTPEEIDTWFKRLKETGMTITRIRMFESYMHKSDGTWDYTLFDHAFKAGEKYGIKIYANLFPATAFTDVGGFKFPRDETHLNSISEYIKNLVNHFKQFSSLYGWVPINEPGAGYVYPEPFTTQKFTEWKAANKDNAYKSKGFVHFDFNEERFLVDYDVWFLKWLAEEVRKHDPQGIVHVNNHGIFQNVAEYNFPEWRKFLTSLGGSAHASWHFGYFKRSQYAVAMSANSEILRSGAGEIPWMMTELQGGNNTYSGYDIMCPTKEEVSQWLWTTIATGSKGAIFWCFNPRMSGVEAGEWALLDYQNNPSDRMKSISKVSDVIGKNAALFANAKVVESNINIIYIRESIWVESKLQTGGTYYDGRNRGGVMKSSLSYFEALSEMGIQSNFKEIDEFDFSKENYTGTTIILSHQISIPSRYWQKLETFVSKGGKLIVDGLTGYYDENAVCLLKDFPLQKLLGGDIKEFKTVSNLFDLTLTDPKLTLSTHLWKGSILPSTAKSIGISEGEVVASRNTYGKGEVFWVPSLMGLAQRIKGNYAPLDIVLQQEAKPSIATVPFRFAKLQPGLMMKTMQSGTSYITLIINKSGQNKTVELNIKDVGKKPVILFSDKQGSVAGKVVKIASEETMIIQW